MDYDKPTTFTKQYGLTDMNETNSNYDLKPKNSCMQRI